MATICGKISADLLNNCDNKPVAGVGTILTLINKDDVGGVVYDTANPQVIRSISLKPGARAYKFEVYKNTHKPRTTSVNRTYGTYQNHEIVTAIMSWDIATKVQVEAMLGSKLIAIAENLQSTGDARVEVYGWDSGLSIAEGAVRDTAANDGVFNFTLANEAEYPEPHLPKTFAVETEGVYDYTATIDAVEALSEDNNSNATLSNLVVTTATLSPAFDANTEDYASDVANATASVTVTPTASDAGSTIKVNGATVASGVTSGTIALTVGDTTIEVVVTAPDLTVKTYTIIITRAEA